MFEIIKSVITRGQYDLTGILHRIDTYHVEGKLTDTERDELYALARGGGMSAGFNAEEEIGKLWEAVRKLQAACNTTEGEDVTEETVKEYVQPTGAHDAYFAGDVVSFNGKVYECIAPAGVAVVWNPDVMPGYWQAMES